ncbi:Uncharacterized protein Fot_36465 [Forsythia ovata]|uniref:Uncharacterized protein n=1 Tax=Forsythia ovata TaxID=205694 RepID=A0ABD1SPI5_9LAMI
MTKECIVKNLEYFDWLCFFGVKKAMSKQAMQCYSKSHVLGAGENLSIADVASWQFENQKLGCPHLGRAALISAPFIPAGFRHILQPGTSPSKRLIDFSILPLLSRSPDFLHLLIFPFWLESQKAINDFLQHHYPTIASIPYEWTMKNFSSHFLQEPNK